MQLEAARLDLGEVEHVVDDRQRVAVAGADFFFQAEDGIRDLTVTGVQTCALPISQRVPESTRSTASAADSAARIPRISQDPSPMTGLPAFSPSAISDSVPYSPPKIGRASCRERA